MFGYDDAAIELPDEEDDNVMAFVLYELGPVTTKFTQDISGKHDDFYAQIAIGHLKPIAT